jgi:hypothetical protein
VESAGRVEEVKGQRDRLSAGSGGRLSSLTLGQPGQVHALTEADASSIASRSRRAKGQDGSGSNDDSALSFIGARRRIYGRSAGDSSDHFNRYIRRMGGNSTLVVQKPKAASDMSCVGGIPFSPRGRKRRKESLKNVVSSFWFFDFQPLGARSIYSHDCGNPAGRSSAGL